jgi:Na+-transporting NADH:ubiquinone oxidoreductase subunit C
MPPDTAPQPAPGGRNILALSNDDPRKIILVAITRCLVCATLVSAAAVLLKPLQERNQALAVKRQIVSVAGLLTEGADVEQLFRERIEVRIVELDSGNYADHIDPEGFDPRAAARAPDTSRALSRDQDIAGIRRRADFAPVYLVRTEERIETIILPIRGYGLWSTMHGFLALAGDARTITGITFYEHAETPGLGDAIEQPAWQAGFHDKLAFDEEGAVRITVVKGHVDPDSPAAHYQGEGIAGATLTSTPAARYQVDGIAGATLTSTGVSKLLHFWLGELGFGPYLARLRTAGDNS